MISTELVIPERARRPDELSAAAVDMADRFARDAVLHGDRANWTVRKINYRGATQPGDLPTTTALGPSYYSGAAGVGVFLLHAHAVSGEARHRDVAEAAIRTGIRLAFTDNPEWRNGFYLGALGVAWAAHEAAESGGDAEFARARDRILDELWARRDEPARVDVMFGAGGAIPPLLVLAEAGAHDRAWDLALHHGRALVDGADVVDGTWSWPGEIRGTHAPNLTGFSHGTAGIGWGLAFLARATGDDAFREAALGAFEYERGHYDEDARNWRDLRNFKTPNKPVPRKFASFWCHGAPGIGLARVHAFPLLGDGRLRDEMRIAAETTRTFTDEWLDHPGRDVCVCHGLSGNMEAAWLMEEALGDPAALENARRVGYWTVDRYGDRHGVDWPTAVAHGTYPPLLTGAGGMGHMLLRLAHPGRFPTVIVPPHPDV